MLQFIEFSIPIMPAFIKLDILRPARPAGYVFPGSVYGAAIQLVKNLLHLPFGSSAGVGELSNFLLGAVFAFIVGMVYKNHKSAAAPMRLRGKRRSHGAHQPAHQLLHRLPRLCGAVRPAAGGHRWACIREILGTVAQVPTSNALLNCLLVFNVPFTPVQGAAGRGAVLPDLQAAEPPAA